MMAATLTARGGRLDRSWRPAVFVAILAAAGSVPFWGNGYVWSFASLTAMWVALTLSWNLISGYTGYVSLGHTAFFGLGAYTGALLYQNLAVPWGWAALIAGCFTAIVAVPLGYILLRLRGPFFAIGMLGLSEVFRIVATRWSSMTGGGAGLYLETSSSVWPIYGVFVAVAVAVFVVTWRIDSLPFGRALLAIRDDEQAAEVIGVRTTRAKVSAFILSAFFPGILGTAYAMFLSYLDPASAFPIEFNLVIVLMGALGGAGTVIGPVIGAVVIAAMRETFWVSFPRLHLVAFGIFMMLTVLLLPRGITPLLRRLVRLVRGEPDPDAGRAAAIELDIDAGRLGFEPGAPPAPATTGPSEAVLSVRGLEKAFGAHRAVDGCSFEVHGGSIVGLIGPNGSGKTTTLNVINGLLKPSGGEVWACGRRIDGQRPYAAADAGVGRTFQLPRLFDRLSVLDNLYVAAPPGIGVRDLQDLADSRLALVGLVGLEHRPAGKLSYGQRKLLEIARMLMRSPGVILMDEPFAGVNPVVRGKIAELVRVLAGHGTAFLIVGHEMTEMMALCERMVVLDHGAVIFSGTPQEVQDDPTVFDAYFGRRDDLVPHAEPL